MSKLLFIDSETTGLAKGLDWEKDYRLFPYVLSLAWKIGKTQKCFIIYQEERPVPKEASDVNGITTKIANDKKKTTLAKDVYTQFLEDSSYCDKVIGFNTYFDISMVKANVLRLFGNGVAIRNLNSNLDKDKRVDVMRAAIKLNHNRWPKLTELYKILFNDAFPAHDALQDVLATERCYYELVKRGML